MKHFIRWSTRLLATCWIFVMLGTTAEIYAAPKPKIPPRVVYIEIVLVDAAGMTITVRPRNSMSTDEKAYKLTPSTTVKVNGTPATLADLKAGMQIHFELGADGVTATELSASPAPRD